MRGMAAVAGWKLGNGLEEHEVSRTRKYMAAD